MSIVKPVDFTLGAYYIPKNENQETSLQFYIDEVENEYLPKLLGVELYDLFIADLDAQGEPQTARFTEIFESFSKQELIGCIGKRGAILYSGGIKQMILGLTYFLSMRDRISRIHTTGIKITDGMNSENVNGIKHDLNARYNKGIETYKAIQYFIVEINKCADYPEFAGEDLPFNHMF
jgi:hypothetical protein